MEKQEALTPIESFKRIMNEKEDTIKSLLPKNVTIEKFKTATFQALSRNEKLLECDRLSLFNSICDIASMGLIPNSKEAVILPFNSKAEREGKEVWIKLAQGIPMVGGFIKLANLSPKISRPITTNVVYEKDQFFYGIKGGVETLDHVPSVFEKNRGKILGAYAFTLDDNNNLVVRVLSAEYILSIKGKSKGAFYKGKPKKSHPWNNEFEPRMWEKTAVRQLMTKLPIESEVIERAIEIDNKSYLIEEDKSVDEIKTLAHDINGELKGEHETESISEAVE